MARVRVPMTAFIWGDLTRTALSEHGDHDAVAVLPVGAVEQHGPHLPTCTDARIVEEVARRTMALLDESVSAVLLPTLPFGFSDHHLPFGGTLSLRADTMASVLLDLVRSISRAGFRRVLMLNGHGGNSDICGMVAKQASVDLDVLVAWASYWKLLNSEAQDGHIPGHAGDFETSIMLAIEPQHVEMAASRPSPAAWPSRKQPGVFASDMRAWARLDGFSGDPTHASAQRGEVYLAQGCELLAEAIAELAQAERGE